MTSYTKNEIVIPRNVEEEIERVRTQLARALALDSAYRESARDPNGHPSGLALDFMTNDIADGRATGDRLAQYLIDNADQLGVDYIIWWQQIWSADRADEGWRAMEDRGSATANHFDHVHISVG